MSSITGAPCLSRQGIAFRITREFREGDVINLGTGIPSLCADYVSDVGEVLLHSEQGLIGFGRRARTRAEVDPYLLNAARQPVIPKPGMSIVDHAESFALVRGGWVDITVLGALEVSINGDLANCWLPGASAGSLGGAQDLAFCAKTVVAALPLLVHPPRLVRKLTLTPTAPGCVKTVFTDIGVIDLESGKARVRELVDGWTLADMEELVDADLEERDGGAGPVNVPADRDEFWARPKAKKVKEPTA